MYSISLVGRITAIASFIIGTILFALFIYLGEQNIPIIIGFKFTIVTVLINFILFLSNFIIMIIDTKNRMELLKTSGAIILNILVIILYLYIMISITFPKGP